MSLVLELNTNYFRLYFVARIYSPAAFILTFLLPVTASYFLGEDPFRALNWNVLRYTFGLHMVWLVNSGAHQWGMRPYDRWRWKKIKFKLVWVEWNLNWYFREMSASETYLVSFFALGEGWHNYHVNQRATRFVGFVINRNFVYSSTAFHGITELRSLHFTGSMFQQCSLISLLS